MTLNHAYTDPSQTQNSTETKDEKSEEQAKQGSYKRFLPLIIIVLALGGGYLSGIHNYFSLESLNENKAALDAFVENNLIAALLSYLTIYIVAVSLSFPGASVLTITGGAIFGWAIGGMLTIIGATIGASIIFLIAKTALGDILASKAGGRLAKLREGFQKDAFNYLLTLRLAPVVPFWITNLAPAFFGMDLFRYAIVTFIGIIPGSFAYSFIGQQVGMSFDKDSSIVTNVTLGLGALAVASVIPLIVKAIRKRRHQNGE